MGFSENGACGEISADSRKERTAEVSFWQVLCPWQERATGVTGQGMVEPIILPLLSYLLPGMSLSRGNGRACYQRQWHGGHRLVELCAPQEQWSLVTLLCGVPFHRPLPLEEFLLPELNPGIALQHQGSSTRRWQC